MEKCEHCSEVNDTRMKIDKIYLILTGNGHPEEGLVFKVAQNTRFVKFWEKFGWAFVVAMLGVPPLLTASIILNKWGIPQ